MSNNTISCARGKRPPITSSNGAHFAMPHVEKVEGLRRVPATVTADLKRTLTSQSFSFLFGQSTPIVWTPVSKGRD